MLILLLHDDLNPWDLFCLATRGSRPPRGGSIFLTAATVAQGLEVPLTTHPLKRGKDPLAGVCGRMGLGISRWACFGRPFLANLHEPVGTDHDLPYTFLFWLLLWIVSGDAYSTVLLRLDSFQELSHRSFKSEEDTVWTSTSSDSRARFGNLPSKGRDRVERELWERCVCIPRGFISADPLYLSFAIYHRSR